MIWRVPNEDDKRWVKRYALWPIKVKDNQNNPYRVWLTTYMACQTYWKNKVDTLQWAITECLSMDAYNERVKYKQLFKDKTGIKYNADTVQDILNELDYNSKI
jgi:hypothetical protein